MGRPVTFEASEKVIRAIVPIAGQRQIESGKLRYGPTNVIAELLDFIVDAHPEILEEFAGASHQASLPGVQYVDVADPEPADRRGRNGKRAASK